VAKKGKRTLRHSQGPRSRGKPDLRALLLPLISTLLLAPLALTATVRENPRLIWSFAGAGAALVLFDGLVYTAARSGRRQLRIDVMLRPQHYLQACAHASILFYWGWYWREVYHAAPLIAAQLAFAYAFDALLTWSRRDTYALGFGPFPIVFSTNLFLWFKPDWFYLQFLMVAVGFAAKELIRWNKEGRQAHIFNPSSFTLTVFSLGLIATGATGITWGPEISNTQLNPPHIYLLIFLVSLPAQVLFGTATMTLSAVGTTYLFGVVYLAATGTHFWFPDSLALHEPLPIAVFLGMHLLFTDPSTSPRTELGRITFGVMYGLSVAGLFSVLMAVGLPSFYDKLLPVPILNLLIRGIDRAVRSDLLRRFDPGSFATRLMPRQRNLVYVSLWIAVFAIMQFQTGALTTLIRADNLLLQGRMDEAIGRYQEFVNAEPSRPQGYQRLGTAMMQAGHYRDAAAPLRRAIELDPSSANTYNSLGAALTQAGLPREALPVLQRATELQHDSAMAYSNLAVAYLRSGQPGAAITPLQRAVALAPDNGDAQEALGSAFVQTGQFKAAVTPLQRAIALKPDSADAHYNLSHALAKVADRIGAIDQLRAAVRIRPDWPVALATLAGLEATAPDGAIQMVDPEEAIRYASRAAELTSGRDAYVLQRLAEAYAAAGRFEEAIRTAQAAEALASTSDVELAAQIRAELTLYRAGERARQVF
jgi:tetratricopeptide (TPR) repeat protein